MEKNEANKERDAKGTGTAGKWSRDHLELFDHDEKVRNEDEEKGSDEDGPLSVFHDGFDALCAEAEGESEEAAVSEGIEVGEEGLFAKEDGVFVE